MSTGTGLLSAGVGFRLGEDGSLSIAVGVQSVRVWVMCGRAGFRACTTGVLSPLRGSTILAGSLSIAAVLQICESLGYVW